MAENTHEDFRRHSDHGKLPSNRSFGLVFTAFFSILAFWPLLRHGAPVRMWAAAAAGVMLLLALAAPGVLEPANRLWMKLGLLLGRIVNPIILSLMFFLVFTPIALVMRLVGRDLLGLRGKPDTVSYWIPREPVAPGTLKNQF
jgi:hypothetical protein